MSIQGNPCSEAERGLDGRGMQERSGARLARWAAAALLVLVALCLPTERAAAQARMDVRELTQQATYVARVRSARISSVVETGMVWTLTSFEVTEAWKGEPPSPFFVRLPGGEAAGQRMTVEGAPRFSEGEEVVLFFTEGRGRQMEIVGWAQGTFRIRKSRRTGIEKVIQDSAMAQPRGLRSGPRPEAERRRIPLTTLRANIERALQ